MAQTKEGIVVILDVSESSRESNVKGGRSFLEKQKDCCIQLLQKKIFAARKDEIAFVLMGTEKADNWLNNNDEDDCQHIVEGIPMQIPNWTVLTTLVNSVNLEVGSNSANWVEAVRLALNIINREEAKRFKYLKIVLFHQFSHPITDDEFVLTKLETMCKEDIIQPIKDLSVEFVVINDFVKYKDDVQTSSVTAMFSNMAKINDQNSPHYLIKKVIDEAEGYLCNFDIAIPRIMHGLKPKGRPWFWNSTLDIGSKIRINIGATISVKTEASLKFSTESAKPNTSCWFSTGYYQNGEEVATKDHLEANGTSFVEELIDGYMLGSTPIPYEKPQTQGFKKGLQCIGFTQNSNVMPQYLVGTGTYLVFAKPSMEASEKMMAALVKALHKNNMVMIGRKVHNDGFKPKFVALYPNTEQKYPCLSMFELYSSEQQINWFFPSLSGKKFEPNDEQYAAIDSLMDAMNLDDESNKYDEIRDYYYKDLLPLDSLPNVNNEYICHVATQRIIEESRDVGISLQGRDNILNVPETIYKKSRDPLRNIKEVFPLEEIKKEGKKELIRHVGNIDSREMNNEVVVDEKPLEYKALISVGTVTPADDFKNLIKREIEDVESEKDVKIQTFDRLTRQIQEVLKDLIFRTITLQYEKIVASLKLYRDESAQYNPYEFNDFMREIKAIAVSRKMYEFWDEVIVQNKLGLLSSRDCYFFNENDDVPDVEEFYSINVEKPMETDQIAANVDDLFDDM